MKLKSCVKGYKKGTHRAVPPKETCARVDPKLPVAGVTRVADITGLDRIGIPVFSSIRPTAEGGAISVYNGKGTTAAEAKVSAMMEAVERYSAEVGDQELRVDSYAGLREHGHGHENVLNPRELILPDYVRDVEAVRIPWVEGYDLMNDEAIYVPANAVFHPLPARYDKVRLFRTNTNGLAGGNELEEAIFHGLAEVIERDAWSLVEITRKPGPTVDVDGGDILALIDKFLNAEVSGLTQIHGAREDTTTADLRRVMGYEWMRKQNQHWFDIADSEDFDALDSVSRDNDDFLDDIKHVLTRLRAAGLERVIVVDLTRAEIGVPVVRVIVPGLEMFGVDGERIGRRCRDARKQSGRIPGTES
jgi:ribosomal protein S12 methylthiotransferase accessory factor YcaO